MARTSGEYLILPIINQQLEYKHQAMTSNTVETLNERYFMPLIVATWKLTESYVIHP